MKERIARIFVFLLGVGWILGTVAFKKLGFSENTFTDLDSLAFYGPGTISGISLGVAMILVAIFSRAISFYVAIWSLVGGVTLLAADNALYFLSPHLPYALLRHMSSEAQGKYLYSNPDPSLAKLANDGKVSFGRPGVVRESKGFRWIYDELGYPNPPGYLKSSSGADVLILGDSFIEVGSIPHYLRQFLAPVTVYAAAISGSGPPRWRLHFQHYLESSLVLKPPKVVVLNFYSGNDISDTVTQNNAPGLSLAELNAASPAWPTRRFSFFQELLSIVQKTVFRGISAWQFPAGKPYFSEPDLSEEFYARGLQETLLTMSGMVEDIRKAAPSAKILLSYQATAVAIYGIDPRCNAYMAEHFDQFGDHLRECEVASAKQLEISKILGEWAQDHGVHYVDPTPELQQKSRTTNLFLENDTHLNPDGCRIYAEAIARRITELGLLGGE